MVNDSDLHTRLVTCLGPTSSIAERYRMLRTSLRFLSVDRPVRSILVTSACPGEGKSLTTSNAAAILAEAGSPVILVDADLRRPSLHRAFRLHNGCGLTTVLAGQAELDSAIQATQAGGLSVLTAGPMPPNPAELLSSPRMGEVLRKLEERATVVMDSPPVMPLTDAVVLAGLVDGVILVVRAGAVHHRLVQRTLTELRKSRARLFGVVLNGVAPGRDSSGYGYYEDRDPAGARRRRRHRVS